MMDAGTSMGLSEIGQGAESTVDVTEVGSFNPNAQAFYGINPHSAHVGVARVVGHHARSCRARRAASSRGRRR